MKRIEVQALVCTDSQSGGSRNCFAPAAAEPVSRVFKVRLLDLTLLYYLDMIVPVAEFGN